MGGPAVRGAISGQQAVRENLCPHSCLPAVRYQPISDRCRRLLALAFTCQSIIVWLGQEDKHRVAKMGRIVGTQLDRME